MQPAELKYIFIINLDVRDAPVTGAAWVITGQLMLPLPREKAEPVARLGLNNDKPDLGQAI